MDMREGYRNKNNNNSNNNNSYEIQAFRQISQGKDSFEEVSHGCEKG
jgi:hypothetical protein